MNQPDISCACLAERFPSIYLDSFEDLPMDFDHVHDHLGPAAPSSTYTQSCILGFTPSQTCQSAFTTLDYSSPSHARLSTGYSSTPNISSLHHQGTSQSHLLYRHIPASQPIITHFSCCRRDVEQQPDTAVERNASSGGDRGLPSISASLSHSNSGQGRPTNFVSLSRKSSHKPSSFLFWKRKANPSSITGTFVIDPLLRLPTGLLKVIDSNLLTPNSHTPAHQNRKNLVLEVENGGIDVDIHLVPSKIPRREAAVTVHPELEQKRSIDVRYLHPDSARTRADQQQTMRRRLGIVQDSDSHAPTRIDLRLKEGRPSSGRKYGLIARIDAPNPRPPFHVLASTIDNASSMPPNTNSNIPRRTKSRRHTLTKPQSKSPIILHLPRTFHGPLTIQVIPGNIDAHVRFSRELSKVAVILSESALSRGYFISSRGLGFDVVFKEEEERDVEGWVVIEEPQVRSPSGNRGGDEWYGDKVDVIVGDGKVYLQFVDELAQDPFRRKKRFWQSLGCR